jgi:hypothetical protein
LKELITTNIVGCLNSKLRGSGITYPRIVYILPRNRALHPKNKSSLENFSISKSRWECICRSGPEGRLK